ncbi:MAG: alanyl-tRNA editing protein [Betaproteobacteria bacterium]|nr:alanyl-tRNA editing protein [Betaproteobacteria bacterium]
MATPTTELYRDQPRLCECAATVVDIQTEGVILDQTVFFAASGGQPGDTGELIAADGTVYPVANTVRDRQTAAHLHCLDGEDSPERGQQLTARIDWPRRYKIMRTHTAMHLLCAAVAETVTGGSFQPLRGRIDFDIPEPPERAAIEAKLNEFVGADAPVTTRWVDQDYLASRPELIRTMAVRPPATANRISLVEIAGIDLQACGGTHVARSGEVGAMRIARIEKKGRLNRRIIIELLDEN